LEHFHGDSSPVSGSETGHPQYVARSQKKTGRSYGSGKCSAESGFSGRRTAIETEEETAAGKLLERLRPDMLNGLAGDVESNEGDDLNGLMRRDAKRAVRVNVPGRVAVHHLHHSNHQNQRDADDPEQRDPGRART